MTDARIDGYFITALDHHRMLEVLTRFKELLDELETSEHTSKWTFPAMSSSRHWSKVETWKSSPSTRPTPWTIDRVRVRDGLREVCDQISGIPITACDATVRLDHEPREAG